MSKYDALLIVSFGGPEKREDVIPFLENVLRGRNVPRERMLEVAEHYYHFDGPIADRACRFTGAIVTGTRCWRIPCARCATTGSSGPSRS